MVYYYSYLLTKYYKIFTKNRLTKSNNNDTIHCKTIEYRNSYINKGVIEMKSLFKKGSITVASILFLVACGGSPSEPQPDPAEPPAISDIGAGQGTGQVDEQGNINPGLVALDLLLGRFPQTLNNPGTPLERGAPGNILRGLVATNNTFPGLFERTLSTEAMDTQIATIQDSMLITIAPDNTFGTAGLATITFGPDQTWVEINQHHEANWHDGTPVTLYDLYFAYKLINSPGYTGVRNVALHFWHLIEGIEEFRSGESDTISGVTLSNNNRTMRIQFTDQLPPSAMFAGGIWTTLSPAHWLQPVIDEVGVAELANHPRARAEILGWGPWIIETVVPGESVLFRANDNYWRGAPLADYLLWEIVPDSLALASLREGLYDFTVQFLPATFFEEHLLFNATNYQIAAQLAPGFGFLYFRVGTMEDDGEGGIVATPRSDNHPIQNLDIRRALAHAVDLQLKADTIQNGLSVPARSILSPFNARHYIEPDIPSFYFDLDLANQILDDAGFTERGADGFRLNLDGTPMTFGFALNQNTFNEQAWSTYIQNWHAIGLNVSLYTGDVIEWTTFVDNVLNSDNWSEDIHIMQSNWNLGANPAPHGLWGADTTFNMSRHTSPEMQNILDRINSPQAWDPEFLRQAYLDWQLYMYNNAVARPMFWGIQTFYVNNRVLNYSTERFDGDFGVSGLTKRLGLSQEQAFVN